MIAKGLDFPNVTLVGVINADTALRQPDWRRFRTDIPPVSTSGRTGPDEVNGEAACMCRRRVPKSLLSLKPLITTFSASQKSNSNIAGICTIPPYSCLSRMIFRGEIDEEVQAGAKQIATILRETIKESELDVEIRGPAPAPITRLKKFYRHHLQIIAEDVETLREFWLIARDLFPTLSNVDFQIDVDAINLR